MSRLDEILRVKEAEVAALRPHADRLRKQALERMIGKGCARFEELLNVRSHRSR